MVEQNFRFAAPLADRFYVMEHGRIVEAVHRRVNCRQTWACSGVAGRLTPASPGPFDFLTSHFTSTQ
jgi:energy-coupling factor transporter ATP-binding protein EcfA2